MVQELFIRSGAIAAILTVLASVSSTQPIKRFTLASYRPPEDGKTDASDAFARLFAEVRSSGGGRITIPPGTYAIAGKEPFPLVSNTHVTAEGAVFVLPESLGDKARIVLFAGEDVSDFSWTGGEFRGRCFDPASEKNTWEPSANTRAIVLTTSSRGRTGNVRFRDIRSEGMAGAVVTVLGASVPGSESEVSNYASDVTVENCTLLHSGKFMWDYGYLWQITVWPEEHSAHERALAARYFPQELIRTGLRAEDREDRVRFDNGRQPLPVARTAQPKDALVFFGDTLPKNIVRGKQYFVVESEKGHIKVAETAGGTAIVFDGGFGPKAKLIHDHFRAFLALYAPLGSGPGKGAFDLVACKDVRVSGCKLSARGDTMHIQKCRNIVFTSNQIVGSRMGAFFLAEYCKNATVTGNTVDGTNGSRVMSVEKSCTDVTIIGNTFRNGGRGSWINQPTNFVLSGNVFSNNTTKCERDPKRGRKTFFTGDYETYAELYFTLHQVDGRYGGVVVTGNIFATGPECGPAITFAPNGKGIIVRENILTGRGRKVLVDPTCQDVLIRENIGAE
ncbi:MAG: right-handed parallel beta-helix repeat-containing protein [Gemmataceae bacterium]